MGTLLIRRNDPEGLAQIERAIGLDTGLSADGCELACEFLRANGRHAEALEFVGRFGPGQPATPPRAPDDRDRRITSYNVCYTKLLRQSVGGFDGAR